MEIITAFFTASFMLAFVVHYLLQWKREQIEPTLSTWIIFTTGVSISFASYVVDSNFDLLNGTLNTVDLLVVLSITGAVAFMGTEKLAFKPFEKTYLVAAGAIVCYGIIFSDAWRSNVFSQVLITVGWIPTLVNMFKQQRNTESFLAWILVLLASLSAAHPPIVNENMLGTLYTLRSASCAFVCLLVMWHFDSKEANSSLT